MPGSSHWRSCHWDEAVVRGKKWHPGPPHTQAQQRDKSVDHVRLRPWWPLDGKDDPSLMRDDDDERHVWGQSPIRRRQGEWGDSAGRMDGSSQGPRRAVAEAIAHPLRIQPCMYSNTIESSSKRPVARARCSYISYYALRPVLRQCRGRRAKTALVTSSYFVTFKY
jgi:hypothetical protein